MNYGRLIVFQFNMKGRLKTLNFKNSLFRIKSSYKIHKATLNAPENYFLFVISMSLFELCADRFYKIFFKIARKSF